MEKLELIKKEDYITKDMSTILKGIAILLMVIHHFYGFPNYYIESIQYPQVEILGTPLNIWIRQSTKICVAIYAFLTGYAYYKNNKQTLKYGIKKCFNFLKKYWFIAYIIFVPIIYFVGHEILSWKTLVLNIFSLADRIIKFGWYVYFYLFAMLTLPLLKKICKGNFIYDFIISIGICILGYNLLENATFHFQFIIDDLRECFRWMPCIIIGYLFAKYSIFDKMENIFRPKNLFSAIIIILMIMGARLKLRNILGFNMDIIYAPVIIFQIVYVINNLNISIVRKIFAILGKNSTNIWFLHAIFMSDYVKEYFQPIAFIPKNPVLVVIWIIILCLPISSIINFIFYKQEFLLIKMKAKLNRSNRVKSC